jgi:hypothetical protein
MLLRLACPSFLHNIVPGPGPFLFPAPLYPLPFFHAGRKDATMASNSGRSLDVLDGLHVRVITV